MDEYYSSKILVPSVQSKDTYLQGVLPWIVFQSGIFIATQTEFSIGSAKLPAASKLD
jgi:hypothetical protein